MAWRALALLQKEIEADRKQDDRVAGAVKELAHEPRPFFWTQEDEGGTRYYFRPQPLRTVQDEDGDLP